MIPVILRSKQYGSKSPLIDLSLQRAKAVEFEQRTEVFTAEQQKKATAERQRQAKQIRKKEIANCEKSNQHQVFRRFGMRCVGKQWIARRSQTN